MRRKIQVFLNKPNRRKIQVFLNKPNRSKIILEDTKKNKNVVYGARSIQAQLGLFARPTEDYDIFTSDPKNAASRVDKKLDKKYGFNYHYTKKGVHKGTYKVKSRGLDLKKGTRDDESVVDFSKTSSPKPKTVIINGVIYRKLNQEAQAKRKALADKNFKFRHKKDLTDLQLIQSATRAANLKLNYKQ